MKTLTLLVKKNKNAQCEIKVHHLRTSVLIEMAPKRKIKRPKVSFKQVPSYCLTLFYVDTYQSRKN